MQTDFLNDWLHEFTAAQSLQPEPIPDSPDAPVATLDERLRVAQKYLDLLERMWPAKAPSPVSGDEARSLQDGSQFPSIDDNFSTLCLPVRLGRYQVTRLIGRGGQGIVYQAIDTVLDRQVALKVPRAQTLASPELRRRFLREARAVAALSHAHLIAVYEAGAWNEICYIASAYCAGPNLSQWLKRQGKPLSIRLAVRLAATLADTVNYIHHQGIVHRDLKPSNVLLEPEGSPQLQAPDSIGYTPMLTDFGLAKLLSAPTDSTATGDVLGTPAYMAPEQASGRVQQIGVATDVYGLGAILYELLTGTPPRFERVAGDAKQAAGAPAFPPTVPQPLQSICRRCLEFDPGRRYQSAGTLAKDLDRYLAGKPIAPVGLWALGFWMAVTAAIAGLYVIVAATGRPLGQQATPSKDLRAGRDGLTSQQIEAAGSIKPLIMLLEEDWEQQQLGDNSNDLLHWRGPASRGLDHPSVHTIVAVNGSQVLRLDASASQTGKPYLGSVPEKPYLPFLAGEMLSARFDAQLSGIPGQLLFVIARFPEGSGYQLQINDNRQAIELVRVSADKSTSTLGATDEGQFPSGLAFHAYELRALLKEEGIEFQVAADNRLLFAASDADPMLTTASTVRFQFQVYPRPGNGQPGKVALLDNIRLAAGASLDFPPLAD
jgi:tRNA A-37 threonylcarbamoyl transferase component Bud32